MALKVVEQDTDNQPTCADEIHELALRIGGTTTGEHGVGVARAPYMAREHGPALDVMKRITRPVAPASTKPIAWLMTFCSWLGVRICNCSM